MPGKNIVKIFQPENFYHVYNRGVNRSEVFLDGSDYGYFEWLLERTLSPSPAKDPKGLRGRTSKYTSRVSVGVSVGFVAGGLSVANDLADGIGRQASVYGAQLQQGSSVAGRNLRTVSQIAKNPAVRVVGKAGGPVAAGVEFAGSYFEGDSLGRNVLETGGGVALGALGASFGAAACGATTFLAPVTCPVLIGGLGAAGSWAGNKFGGAIADVFGW